MANPKAKWGPGITAQRELEFDDKLGTVETKMFRQSLDDRIEDFEPFREEGNENETSDSGSHNLHTSDAVLRVHKLFRMDIKASSLSKPVVIFLRIFGLLLASGAAIVSTRNSYEWFVSLRPAFLAALMAVSMVGSGILLPDFAIALWKSNRRWLGGFFLLTGLIAIFFCMATTIAALYNTRTVRTGAQYELFQQSKNMDAQAAEAREEKKSLEASLRQINSFIADTQPKVAAISADDTLTPVSQTLIGRLERYLAQKRQYEGKVAELDKIILSSIQEKPTIRMDFYGFLADIFHSNPDSIEFTTGAIPSIFLELVAPLMMGVALFL
jgi:hypothetical protein